MVAAQGYNTTAVDISLRNETANLVRAGYNVRSTICSIKLCSHLDSPLTLVLLVLWQGPEQPIENQADRLEAQHWDVTAVGWGIRGAPDPVITTLFEGTSPHSLPRKRGANAYARIDILHQFRKSAPKTPTVFNWSPTSLAFSVIRRIPLNEDCTDKPGTLYVSL